VGMWNDVGAISLGMAGMNKNGAKMMGISLKEYDSLLAAFKQSGMTYAIDQHQFIEAAVIKADQTLKPQSLTVRVSKAPLVAVKKAYQLAKTGGFDAGEFINITGHWLVARRRYQKLNPGANMNNAKVIEDVGVMARELAYSMNRAGKIGHQGYPTSAISELLSVPLQFYSVPHKAIMSMTTSKALSKEEKRRLIGLNIALFGAGAIPFMNDGLDEVQKQFGMELTDGQWAALKGGLMDWGLSNVLNFAFAEDDVEYLKFSASSSPTSGAGAPIENILKAVASGNVPKAAFGASFNVGSRIMEAIDDVYFMMDQNDWSTPDLAMAGMKTLLNITGGGNNYFKSKFARKYHYLVSSKGARSADVGEVAAMMKIFGIMPYSEHDYYKNVLTIAEMTKDVNELVDNMVDSHLKLQARDLNKSDWQAEVVLLRHLWNLVGDDTLAFEIAKRRFDQRFDMARSNTATTIGNKLVKKIAHARSSDLAGQIYNMSQANQGIPEEVRTGMREFMDVLTKQKREGE